MNRAIFWDSDGTLLYNNESFKCSMMRTLEQFGYIPDAERVGAFMRANCSWYFPEKDHAGQTGAEWWSCLLGYAAGFLAETGVQNEDVSAMCARFRENVISYEYRLYEDAEEILAYFEKSGYKNYVISNNFPELDEVFGRLGIGRYISGFILSANAGYEKPREEIFRYARELAGEPDECWMVGDNPNADYLGGMNAGMTPVLVHNKPADVSMTFCAELTGLKEIIK